MTEQLDAAIQELYRRAATDEDLRARLKSDVRATLRQELGVEVPPEIEIEVVEEAPGKMVLVLPHLSAAAELSDAELDKAAGGFWSLSSFRTRLSGGTGTQISSITYQG
ncbi:MAG TPA: NHLP leader peptide family RiPP precursor [Thermoanaerobaculia bacterium]|nr:NHLP leader peptide family RiPP precursor [Thermoanaerobaculia bacterium]